MRRGTKEQPLSEAELGLRVLKLVLDFSTKLNSLARTGALEGLAPESEVYVRLAKLRDDIDALL